MSAPRAGAMEDMEQQTLEAKLQVRFVVYLYICAHLLFFICQPPELPTRIYIMHK